MTPLELNKKMTEARQRLELGGGRAVAVQVGDGLMLVLRASSASWVVRRQVDGKRTDKTLGAHPAMSLKEARRAAAMHAPGQADAAAPVPAKAGPSFEALFEEWLAHGSDGPASRRNKRVAFAADVLPVLGSKEPHQVERADTDAILRTMEARGALDKLRRVRMWLSMVFEYAIDSELWPNVTTNPVRQQLLSFKKGKKRHYPAITNAGDVPELMRAIRLTNSTITRHALMLNAYVWQRPSEVREAVWAEFDLDAATWRIPAARMKVGREHWVPLPRQAVQLLRLHQELVGKTGYLFPGLADGKPISNVTLQKRLREAGFAGRHTPHGFRAMGRTLGVEVLGFDPQVLERHLSHEKSGPLGAAYDRAEFWPQRVDMIQRWADWLDQQL
jgi:integrase